MFSSGCTLYIHPTLALSCKPIRSRLRWSLGMLGSSVTAVVDLLQRWNALLDGEGTVFIASATTHIAIPISKFWWSETYDNTHFEAVVL